MMATFEIAPGRFVGGDNPCFIIAEIGQNHQGDIKIAKEMIKMAKDCGADCAKFQKCKLDEKFNKKALERPYNSVNAWAPLYGKHKEYIEFSEEEFIELKKYADEIGIVFSSSAGDASSVDFLERMDLPFFKIASPDCGNLEFVKHAASKGKPLVISTGMQDMDTVRSVYKAMKSVKGRFSILQCTSTYPLDPVDAHLQVIQSYRTEFPECVIGYSGHEGGTAISIAAIALGAKVLERHVTLDKTLKGNDHKASLEPQELKSLIDDIRNVEKAMGTTGKRVRDSEKPFIRKLGKTLVAAKDLPAGHVITECDVVGKVAEPPGIRVEHISKMLGRAIKECVCKDATVLEENLL